MKNFLKKIAVFLAIVAAVSATFGIISHRPIYAADDENETRSDGSPCEQFLGLTNWDCGFQEITDQSTLISGIVVIASNILTDVTVIASYLIIGYVMYGGFLYIFSSGDPTKAAAGKKTLIHAFIGLGIVLSAYTIFSSIRIALIGHHNLSKCNPLSTSPCVDGNKMITNLISWVIGIVGVTCAAFIVIGSWGYITAAGDPNKLTKAKNTIIYALIGLIIVALTGVITAFVSSVIREANANETEETSFKSSSIIVNINNKEIPNETT